MGGERRAKGETSGGGALCQSVRKKGRGACRSRGRCAHGARKRGASTFVGSRQFLDFLGEEGRD